MRAFALRSFATQHFNLLQPGGTDVLSKTVVLTDAQIKALPSTSIEVVPAPGVGFYTVPIFCVIELKQQQFYTNVTDNSQAQGASDIVVTWGDNWVNAFRAVPMRFFSAFFNGNRVAFCDAFMGVSDPTVVADQLWAHVMSFPFNGAGDRVENNALKVSADNTGNFTGGDPANTMAVTVWYETRAFGAA